MCSFLPEIMAETTRISLVSTPRAPAWGHLTSTRRVQRCTYARPLQPQRARSRHSRVESRTSVDAHDIRHFKRARERAEWTTATRWTALGRAGIPGFAYFTAGKKSLFFALTREKQKKHPKAQKHPQKLHPKTPKRRKNTQKFVSRLRAKLNLSRQKNHFPFHPRWNETKKHPALALGQRTHQRAPARAAVVVHAVLAHGDERQRISRTPVFSRARHHHDCGCTAPRARGESAATVADLGRWSHVLSLAEGSRRLGTWAGPVRAVQTR